MDLVCPSFSIKLYSPFGQAPIFQLAEGIDKGHENAEVASFGIRCMH